jgi:YD repeat-containing protein
VVGGPDPYWRSYRYDTIRTYTYPAPGSPRSYALSSITQTGGAGGRTDAFSYDADGNTAGRDVGDVAQSLEWDSEGELSKVTEGNKVTSYVYDSDGDRLLRRDLTGTTCGCRILCRLMRPGRIRG